MKQVASSVASQVGFPVVAGADTPSYLSETYNFTSGDALPSWLNYTRADALLTYRDSDGKLKIASTNTNPKNHDINGNQLGFQIYQAGTNKNTNYNVNPTDATGMSIISGTGVISVVDDTAALAAAKLDAICTSGKVYYLDNTASGGTTIYAFGGTCGNTNPHSYQVYARMAGAYVGTLSVNAAGSATNTMTGTAYTYYKNENITIDNASRYLRVSLGAGRGCYIILNQLEESKFCTPIIPVAGATATRNLGVLQQTTLSNIPLYSATEGSIVVDTAMQEIVNHTSAHGVIFAEGTGLTNTMSCYALSGRSKTAARVMLASANQSVGDVGSMCKAGATARYPFALSWQAGSRVNVMSGAGIYKDVTLGGTITGIDRLIVGSRSTGEALNGHIRGIKIYNKYRTPAQLGTDMVKSGENIFLFTGQSLATVHFSAQSGSDNGGQRAGQPIMDAVYPSARNWLVNGGTAGTSVKYYPATSNDTNYWINTDTLEQGAPFRRCLEIVAGNANATKKGIIDVCGESDAGNCTIAEFKAAQLLKYQIIFAAAGVSEGAFPVFVSLIGRNTNADFAGYQTIREAMMEMARDYAWIYLLPEKFDGALEGTDGIHTTNAANIIINPRWIRKALSVLGETITGAVDGSTVSAVSRSVAAVTVTLTHPSGITDFTPSTGIEGFAFLDGASVISITAAVRTNATTITLTLASTPTNATQTLYYARNSLASVNTTNLVKGNDSNALPMNAAKWVSVDTGTTWASAI